jgi:hypothetical protein
MVWNLDVARISLAHLPQAPAPEALAILSGPER